MNLSLLFKFAFMKMNFCEHFNEDYLEKNLTELLALNSALWMKCKIQPSYGNRMVN